MADLTAIILTKNESKNIVNCLDSIKDIISRAVVVDCGSTDNTVQLAKEHGADVYYHPFEYYAKQFNWAIDNTNIITKWILRLDADERFTPELCKEMKYMMELHDDDDVNGLAMEASFYFMNKRLKYGSGKKRKMMAFKCGIGRLEDRKRDAHSVLSYGSCCKLRERYLHYDFKDLNTFIIKFNWYATREMQDYLEYKKGLSEEMLSDKEIQLTRKLKFGFYYRLPSFSRCWILFIYNYIFRLGFLDGKEGYMYHFLQSFWYRSLVDAKIYEHLKMGTKIEKLRALGE